MQLDVEVSPPANIWNLSSQDSTSPLWKLIDTFRYINFFLVKSVQTDGRTESDAYEPTVHKHRWAQISTGGLKNETGCFHSMPVNSEIKLLSRSDIECILSVTNSFYFFDPVFFCVTIRRHEWTMEYHVSYPSASLTGLFIQGWKTKE